MAEDAKVPTFEELQASMAEALKSGDPAKIEEAATAIAKSKSARAKAEAEAQRKEAEALAGKREALAKRIDAAVRPIISGKELLAVKAKGFTFTVDHLENDKGQLDPNGTVRVTGGTALMVPAVRSRKGGAGGAGKTKDEYGLSLDEVFEKFATDEERDKLNAAESNSAKWAVKNAVKKRVIASGDLKPVS